VTRRALHLAVLLCLLGADSAAQPELSGAWRTVRHEDLPDRGPGVGLGDYTGIPLTDAARHFAESWDAASLSMPQQQCRVHVAPYIYRGPMNLRVWEEKDPRTQEVVAFKHYISTYEQTRTIWMDGRPHPPEHAPHTWMGFSTGRWVGDRLVVETTHLKHGWHRRNGVPSSDWTTMTEHYVRHGNTFTHIAVIRDPVYLTEPMVKSQHFEWIPRALPSRSWLWPCTVVEEVARDPEAVPHFLPGRNPYLESSRREVDLLVDGVEGGAATIYPEWLTGASERSAASGDRRLAVAPARAADAARSRAAVSPSTRAAVSPSTRAPDAASDVVEIWPIRDNVFLLAGAGANTAVQVGDDGVLVVDTKREAASDALLAAIATLSDKPIRYVLNTHAHADHMGGNAAVAAAGATRTGGVVVAQIGADIVESAAIVAHENVLARVAAPSGAPSPVPQAAWPTETFFTKRRELTFNGDGIELRHFPAAHTDGDMIVYFRRADVIAAGGLFSTVSYPVVDKARGGTLRGVIEALNAIIEVAIPDVDHQGGTMIVPGHGRLSDEFDVAEYRDMITIVRDRVADMIERGYTRDQVHAARPTLDWDARYGADSGAWTTAMFVDAVYDDVTGGAAEGRAARDARETQAAREGQAAREPQATRAAQQTQAALSRPASTAEAAERPRGAAVTRSAEAAVTSVPAPGSPRAVAPVDVTGYWVSVITEDWAWRMRTPPKGDYASVPLNGEGVRVADTWTQDQDGSCLAFGAAAVLRMPTRVHIAWEDDWTLKLETDNGVQTRWLRFDRAAPSSPPSAPGSASGSASESPSASAPRRSLQGDSRAEWKIVDVVTGSGADSGVVATQLEQGRWAPLEVVTTNLAAAWLRPNGVPHSENAIVTEHFDRFEEGDDEWFTVTTIVDDPVYLTEPLVISSNFKREPDGSKWRPAPCRD
jgi:cyclase